MSGYEPSSDFLISVLNDEAPLFGSHFADENLRRIIEMVDDNDDSNRDWAVFILGNLEQDSPPIRAALAHAADDPNKRVAAEAIVGLASKDRVRALPFVRRELDGLNPMKNIFEAARIVAHPALVDSLELFVKATDDRPFDELVIEALKACQGRQTQ